MKLFPVVLILFIRSFIHFLMPNSGLYNFLLTFVLIEFLLIYYCEGRNPISLHLFVYPIPLIKTMALSLAL